MCKQTFSIMTKSDLCSWIADKHLAAVLQIATLARKGCEQIQTASIFTLNLLSEQHNVHMFSPHFHWIIESCGVGIWIFRIWRQAHEKKTLPPFVLDG